MEAAGNISKVISKNKESGCIAYFGIGANELIEELKGALNITNDRNISGILGGELPSGFDNNIEKSLPILGTKKVFGER
jgi:hypothetical protein